MIFGWTIPLNQTEWPINNLVPAWPTFLSFSVPLRETTDGQNLRIKLAKQASKAKESETDSGQSGWQRVAQRCKSERLIFDLRGTRHFRIYKIKIDTFMTGDLHKADLTSGHHKRKKWFWKCSGQTRGASNAWSLGWRRFKATAPVWLSTAF